MKKIILFNTDKCPGSGNCGSCLYSCRKYELKIPKNKVELIQITADQLFEKTCSTCSSPTCILDCPQNAITITENEISIDEERCDLCGWCFDRCPAGALSKKKNTLVAYLCNMCGDAPQCVQACFRKAIKTFKIEKEERGKKFFQFFAFPHHYFVINPAKPKEQ